MDSSSAAQSELLVAVEGGISYKNGGRFVLKANTQGLVKKPYQRPMLRVYGDIRTMTQAVASSAHAQRRPNGIQDESQNFLTIDSRGTFVCIACTLWAATCGQHGSSWPPPSA